MTASLVTVLVAHADTALRSRLAASVEGGEDVRESPGSGDLMVVAEAADGVEAVTQALQLHPDVVVLDVRIPLLSAPEVVRRIGFLVPAAAAVLVSAEPVDGAQISEGLAAGAAGCVAEDESATVLRHGLRLAAAGGAAFSPAIVRRVWGRAGATGVTTPEIDTAMRAEPAGGATLMLLTERELEVARAVAGGATNQSIAHELHMSVSNVKTHLAKILTKTGLSSRLQLALLVAYAASRLDGSERANGVDPRSDAP